MWSPLNQVWISRTRSMFTTVVRWMRAKRAGSSRAARLVRLSRYDAIRTATVDAAEFLREPGEFGVVRAGARADLLLVAGNPLEDLRRLTSPSAVMVRGRWVHVAP